MLSIERIFAQVEEENKFEYRNPFGLPYANPKRMTDSQRIAWRYMKDHIEQAPVLAMIGAKGSAKTHFGSAFAFEMGQRYPGSVGCVISNTYQQTKDNAGAMFMKMARTLGFKAEFFSSKKIFGESITSLYVVDLDGKGYNDGNIFYLLLRSFENVNKLEGIEIDWLWVEEIQQADQDRFITVNSRIRGQKSPNLKFIAGMPEDDIHWQYTVLPRIGALEWEKREQGQKVIGKDPHTGTERERYGVLLEPTVYENKKNLPDNYIDQLYATYDKEMAERYIFGRRTSLTSNKVAYNYRDWEHRTGIMSEMLCHYSDVLPLVVSIDFNAANMHATLWQKKPWSDNWADGDTDSKPDREVLAQVDEFQLKEGGTRNLMNRIMAKYGNHFNGMIIVGDAAGNHEHSSAAQSDWDIITTSTIGVHNRTIIRGLVQNADIKTGRVKYSNPPKRDQINALNLCLIDAQNQSWICFLPKSEYIDGGAAASVFAMKRTPDGKIDDKCDRSEVPDTPKTHFFDTVCYASYWFRGGINAISASDFKSMVREVTVDAKVKQPTFNGEKFNRNAKISFGKSWGGLF